MLVLRGLVRGVREGSWPAKEKGKPPIQFQEVTILGGSEEAPEVFKVMDFEGFAWRRGEENDVPVTASIREYQGKHELRFRVSDSPRGVGAVGKETLKVAAGGKGV